MPPQLNRQETITGWGEAESWTDKDLNSAVIQGEIAWVFGDSGVVRFSQDSGATWQNHTSLGDACAWATAREAVKSCNILVCDYNHVFIDSVREASLPSMGVDIENTILIVDEAHNLPDRVRNGMERRRYSGCALITGPKLSRTSSTA